MNQQTQQQAATALVQRIMQESTRCQSHGWKVDMDEKNCGHWTLSMPIPEDAPACPYGGRTFILDVNILWDYPNTSPEITFRSDIFHPHFFNGCNCLGCNAPQRWSKHFSVTQALLAVRDMIMEPYPRSSSVLGPITCEHIGRQPMMAGVLEARRLFPYAIDRFVELSIRSHRRGTADLVNQLITEKLWQKKAKITQALLRAYLLEKALAPDVPYAHGPACELNKRVVVSPGVVASDAAAAQTMAAARAQQRKNLRTARVQSTGGHIAAIANGPPPRQQSQAQQQQQQHQQQRSTTPALSAPSSSATTPAATGASGSGNANGGGDGRKATSGAGTPVVPSRLSSVSDLTSGGGVGSMRTTTTTTTTSTIPKADTASNAAAATATATTASQQQQQGAKRRQQDGDGTEQPTKLAKQGSSSSLLPRRSNRIAVSFAPSDDAPAAGLELLQPLLPQPERSVLIVRLQSTERLSTDTVVCQNVDTPQDMKLTIAMNQIGPRTAVGQRQTLRCAKCSHPLRDDLELWQHRIQSSDLVTVSLGEKCNCTIFNLQKFKYSGEQQVPSLKLLCKHAVSRMSPAQLEEKWNKQPHFFKKYIKHPSPDASVKAIPYFPTQPVPSSSTLPATVPTTATTTTTITTTNTTNSAPK